jgi:hypothetical protein
MKINIDILRQMVRETIEEAAKEGSYQKYARSTFNKMIKLAKKGGNKNTPPFTDSAPSAGKSAPPGQK